MKKRVMMLMMLSLGSSALAQQKVELEFWTWYLSPKFDDFINGLARDFEARNPNISVKVADKQDSMVQDLLAAINLGKSPDVVNLNIDETFKAAQNGFLVDISTLTPNSKLKGMFWDNPLKNFTVAGKPYGYPWYGWLNEGVMSYNSELLAKAGISKLPKTTDELLKASQTVKDKTGAYGWVPVINDPNSPAFLGLFYADGLAVYDPTGNAAFNSSKHVALLEKYINLYKKGYFPEDVLRKEAFQLSMELYSQGKLAFIVGGPQALTRVKDTNKDLYSKTKVAVAPLGKAKKSTGGGMSLVIPAASKHKKEAAMLAEFIANNVNQMKFAKIVPIVPTSKGAEKDAFFQRSSSDPIEIASGMVGASGKLIDPGFKPPANADAIYKNLSDNIEAAFLGRKSAEDALNDAVKYWNSNAKK